MAPIPGDFRFHLNPPFQLRHGASCAHRRLVFAAQGGRHHPCVAIRAADATRLRDRAEDQSVPTVSLITPGATGEIATLDLPGRLEAYSRASIYARVSGYLKSWNVDIGSPVKAGQLLAEIDSPDLDQQLLQAKADLASAQANASLAGTTSKRWQSMLGSDSVSRQRPRRRRATPPPSRRRTPRIASIACRL